MGEYTSTAKKTREILTAVMLFGVAIGIYYLSQISQIPYPIVFQTVSVLLLVAAILIVTRFVMRRFTCRLEENQAGSVDFVVIEHYGKRNTTVCRVYASQLCSAVRYTKETWKASAEKRKGKRLYRYTGGFPNHNRALIEIGGSEGVDPFFLEVEIDDVFLALLNQHCRHSFEALS